MTIQYNEVEHTELLNSFSEVFHTTLEAHGAEIRDESEDSVIYYLNGVFFYLRMVQFEGCKPFITLNASYNGELLSIKTNISKVTVYGAGSELEMFISKTVK